jgi:hypothetical protein
VIDLHKLEINLNEVRKGAALDVDRAALGRSGMHNRNASQKWIGGSRKLLFCFFF